MGQELDLLLKKIRPYLINQLQNAKVEQYKELYRQNNGEGPNKNQINDLINTLILNGQVVKEADSILDDLRSEFNKKIRNENYLSLIKDSVFSIPSLIIFALYIVLYLRYCNILNVSKNKLFNISYFILAVIMFFATLGVIIKSIIKKTDGLDHN